LPGNEAADAAAKAAALHGTLTSDRALGSDVHTFLHHAVLSSWQGECAYIQGNKLCMEAIHADVIFFLQSGR
jgi:hypothetical protein